MGPAVIYMCTQLMSKILTNVFDTNLTDVNVKTNNILPKDNNFSNDIQRHVSNDHLLGKKVFVKHNLPTLWTIFFFSFISIYIVLWNAVCYIAKWIQITCAYEYKFQENIWRSEPPNNWKIYNITWRKTLWIWRSPSVVKFRDQRCCYSL